MKIKRPKDKTRKVTKTMITRSVASSTAVETGQPVSVIEAKLKAGSKKFQHLTLAS
jgi:cellulose biosynthesis protein BcsQ